MRLPKIGHVSVSSKPSLQITLCHSVQTHLHAYMGQTQIGVQPSVVSLSFRTGEGGLSTWVMRPELQRQKERDTHGE